MCWLGCRGRLHAVPIAKRLRRGKVVEVPSRWVGAHPTKKTLRDRRSLAKAKRKRLAVHGKLVSKARFRSEGREAAEDRSSAG